MAEATSGCVERLRSVDAVAFIIACEPDRKPANASMTGSQVTRSASPPTSRVR
jgi:hypothetical protein